MISVFLLFRILLLLELTCHQIHINNLYAPPKEVKFSKISNLNPKILEGFRILCDIVDSKGQDVEKNIDLVHHWNKFNLDDRIRIRGDLKTDLSFFIENFGKDDKKQ